MAGSGKTTLGKKLTEVLGAPFLEENWQDIPFISRNGEEKYSNFEVSIGFLNMRYTQIKKAEGLTKEGQTVFIDTVFEMTDVYSRQILKDDEYAEFKKVYEVFTKDIVQPDGYIFLTGNISIIRERALARNLGVDLEKTFLTIQSLEKAKAEIEGLLKTKKEGCVLKIDVTQVDVRDNAFVKTLGDKLFPPTD